jgi:hypothetical protein
VTTYLGWKTLEDLPVSTAVCWYSSLLYALLSICTAVQQNIALSRVNSYGDRDERSCTFIGVNQVAGRASAANLEAEPAVTACVGDTCAFARRQYSPAADRAGRDDI